MKQETVPCVWIPCGCNAFDACDRCGGRGGHYGPVAKMGKASGCNPEIAGSTPARASSKEK